MRERSPTSWSELIAEMVGAFPIAPTILFGHCLGAIVAFEVARELRRRDLPGPSRLIITGDSPRSFASQAAPMSVRDAVRASGALSEDVINNDAIFAMFEPAIAGDLNLAATYDYLDEPPIDVPLDLVASAAQAATLELQAEEWKHEVTGPLNIHVVPGEKLFPHDAWIPLSDLVVELSKR